MMPEQTRKENAVAAIRVSTIKQGVEGDSPEAQREQIERWASTHNVHIKEFFIFLESGSKDDQPVQKVVDFCKDPKNDIQLCVIKSIDRFTRGGSYTYDHLKMQLERYGVKLVDIYGVISSQKINTLEHLGVQYSWSTYSPTQKAEILEAERAKDEVRDIMSRMIGAEIRYTRMGYWMRQPPYGLASEKVDTPNGKRTVLIPHPKEALFMRKLFEMRASGMYDDKQIAEALNVMGYVSRIEVLRDKHDRTKVIGQRGGKKITAKEVGAFVQKPIYAGVICEKWTDDKPVLAKFEGLISTDLYNRANKNKRVIVVTGGEVQILKRKPLERYATKKGTRHADFAYRKFVVCPSCLRPLLGSASRGKMGKYYPAYHCNMRGHYFRVTKAEFEATIETFVSNIKLSPEYIEAVNEAVVAEWDKHEGMAESRPKSLEDSISGLQAQIGATVSKIKVLSSEVAIKYMEEELVSLENQILDLKAQRENAKNDRPINIRILMANVKYYMEHLEELLLQQRNPVARAEYFGLLFNKVPTYEELKYGTQKPLQLTGVNELFKLKEVKNDVLVTSRRIELRLPG